MSNTTAWEQRLANLDSTEATRQLRAAEESAHVDEGEAGQAGAAVPLVRALASPVEGVAAWCTSALEKAGPPRDADLPELIELAGSDDLTVAFWAATLLGRAEARAAAALPVLQRQVQQAAVPALRQRAAWAVDRIQRG